MKVSLEKKTVCEIHTKLPTRLKWHIFHILITEDIDKFSTFFPVVVAKGQWNCRVRDLSDITKGKLLSHI